MRRSDKKLQDLMAKLRGIKVKSLKIKKCKYKVQLNDKIDVVFPLLKMHDITVLPVYDKDKFVGGVDERDLLKMLLNPSDFTNSIVGIFGLRDEEYVAERVKEIVTKYPVTLSPESSIAEVAEQMFLNETTAIPIMKDGKLLGIVTIEDMFRKLEEI